MEWVEVTTVSDRRIPPPHLPPMHYVDNDLSFSIDVFIYNSIRLGGN